MMDEHNILPINKRVRKLKNWDLPPPGYEDKTVQEVKALGKGRFLLQKHKRRSTVGEIFIETITRI